VALPFEYFCMDQNANNPVALSSKNSTATAFRNQLGRLTPGRGWNVFWAVFALISVTMFAYLPVFRAGFVWDDDASLTNYSLIKASHGLFLFWFSTVPADYWPVTATTLWMEWRIWGINPLGYHVTNLILHVSEALLLWATLRRLRVPGAYLAALIFAVHPVNVESVAWIAQRKNLMAMLFFLLSINFFLKTDLWTASYREKRRRSGPGRWYWLSLLALTLGMLSKGSVAMLPVVLVGLMLSRNQSFWRSVVSTSPFFLIAGVFALVDIWFQAHHLSQTVRHAGLLERFLGAGAIVWFYLSKALLPIDLNFAYPLWRIRPETVRWWLPLVGAGVLTFVLWHLRNTRLRPILFAWGFFCVCLVPVMGFTDVYFMKYSLVADHYQHIAIIGIISLVAAAWRSWNLTDCDSASGSLSLIAAVAIVGLLATLTWRQCEKFKDPETLYRSVLDKNPASTLASGNLGEVLSHEKRYTEAIAILRTTIDKDPNLPEVHADLGNALEAIGDPADAAIEYSTALRLSPTIGGVHYLLGESFIKAGRLDEAVKEIRAELESYDAEESMRSRKGTGETGTGWIPGSMVYDAHINLGLALLELGRREEALKEFRWALAFNPLDLRVRNSLGLTLAGLGRAAEAIEAFQTVLKTDPKFLESHLNLGLIFLRSERFEAAIEQYQLALNIDPGRKEAHLNLGNALFRSGKLNEAVGEYRKAILIDPDYLTAHKNLSEALNALGRSSETRRTQDSH
jgi:protein O-mannosyl-transferase